MTKFFTFIALLGGGVLSIAQTTLKPSVFIDTKSDDFKKGIVEIKEYTNYEVYQQLQRNLKSGNSAAINADMIRQAFITRKIALQKGTYIIDNNEQHFEFEIGNSGQLVGEGKFVNKKRNIPSTYIFNNGKLAEIHIFTPEGRLRKKNIFKGNTIEGLVYDHAGNIAQKIEIYTNLKEGADQIVTNYHKNGNPSKEVNTIKNTTKEYYQNGKLKLEQINSKTTTKYDPEGKITEKWYVTEKGNCKELYEKGVISQKICEDRSIKETTVSTYKNGKLLETKKL
ncbi:MULTISPECIES: hypothetical protein [Capnocytophaga]|jgi:hypothetical protein|uniref:Toxin-antitoxin system YwqK family antitoxin n=1 Tax=Capnocytophaga genosp. AHN8471 TaxID=327574 RepID=A0ABS1YVU0_9FLAO|nr:MULTISPECIES: hypothetical protein [Capnocytophaga]MBI1667519.1 hypothetical protein [Capnocytophaga periodontitidis]MBM0650524.1 hypothetical protein [Capnocytophaga genosp. AHN8471]MBM0661712.1 hypothetical protein [Capnocytophaga genosp. AHN8471]